MEVRSGDVIPVTALGSPGQDMWFQFAGDKTRYPMAESLVAKGTYRGAYIVQPDDDFNGQTVLVTLTAKNRSHQNKEASAKAKIWRLKEDTPWVVEVSTDLAILRAAAAELMQQPFAEEGIDAEFEGAVSRLLEGEHKRVFAVLQEKVQQLGVSGLSSEEKQQYLAALGARRM
jgi:hypothetical protein